MWRILAGLRLLLGDGRGEQLEADAATANPLLDELSTFHCELDNTTPLFSASSHSG